MKLAEPGTYLHNCEFNEGELIDETMGEFLACRCYDPDAAMLAAQDAIAVELDAQRGNIGP
jgi:hypothetical protein